jgi:hypothetical protein
VSVYLSMHFGWPSRLEEAVPKRAKVADSSSDRAPRGKTDRKWVGKLVVSFQLTAGYGLPGTRPATRYVSVPPAYSFQRLPELTEVRLFLWCHDLTIRAAPNSAQPDSRSVRPQAESAPRPVPHMENGCPYGYILTIRQHSVERRKFDLDFRDRTVRLVRETEKPIAELTWDLGIGAGTVGNWVNIDRRRPRASQNSYSGSDDRPRRLAGTGARSAVPALWLRRRL